jgi:hypothetical protein
MLVVVVVKIEYGTMSKELLFTAGCDYLTIEGLEQPESADDDDDEEGDEEEEEEYGGLLRLKVDHVKAAFGAPATFDFRFLKKEVEDGINPEHGLAPKDHNAVAVGYVYDSRGTRLPLRLRVLCLLLCYAIVTLLYFVLRSVLIYPRECSCS